MNQTDFAVAVLHRLKAPTTRANVKAMVAWQNAEGGHWHNDAKYNPLNTTQPMAGAGNTGTQGNIKVYRNWQQGLDATVKTLRNGNYTGILNALSSGRNAAAVVHAVGASPWGTNGLLLSRVLGTTPTPAVNSSVGARNVLAQQTVGAPTITASQVPDQRKLILAQLLAGQGQNAQNNPLFATGVLSTDPAQMTKTAMHLTPGSTTTSSPMVHTGAVAGKPKDIFELFWQGKGGIDAKYGQIEPQGFVSGHTDHVHVAASPKRLLALGRTAQRMGLHVGENPNFGGVHPVHVKGSFHYKGEAIDVSGDPTAMRKYAHLVAHRYGIQ